MYKQKIFILLLGGFFLLATGCTSFGKGTCDRCPEYTQATADLDSDC